jgi:SAM-dependent methyltransferase
MGQDPEKALAIPQRQIWEKIHKDSASTTGVDDQTVTFLDFVGDHLLPDSPVLDAGCGKGRHSTLLNELEREAWGCDLSEAAIRQARLRIDSAVYQCRFQVADLRALPYPNSVFSAAICVHTLPYHLRAEIEEIIFELERVILPGGWLYADFLDISDIDYGHGARLEENTFRDESGLPTHFCRTGEIESLFSRFRLVRPEKIRIGDERRTRVAWTVWAQIDR